MQHRIAVLVLPLNSPIDFSGKAAIPTEPERKFLSIIRGDNLTVWDAWVVIEAFCKTNYAPPTPFSDFCIKTLQDQNGCDLDLNYKLQDIFSGQAEPHIIQVVQQHSNRDCSILPSSSLRPREAQSRNAWTLPPSTVHVQNAFGQPNGYMPIDSEFPLQSREVEVDEPTEIVFDAKAASFRSGNYSARQKSRPAIDGSVIDLEEDSNLNDMPSEHEYERTALPSRMSSRRTAAKRMTYDLKVQDLKNRHCKDIGTLTKPHSTPKLRHRDHLFQSSIYDVPDTDQEASAAEDVELSRQQDTSENPRKSSPEPEKNKLASTDELKRLAADSERKNMFQIITKAPNYLLTPFERAQKKAQLVQEEVRRTVKLQDEQARSIKDRAGKGFSLKRHVPEDTSTVAGAQSDTNYQQSLVIKDFPSAHDGPNTSGNIENSSAVQKTSKGKASKGASRRSEIVLADQFTSTETSGKSAAGTGVSQQTKSTSSGSGNVSKQDKAKDSSTGSFPARSRSAAPNEEPTKPEATVRDSGQTPGLAIQSDDVIELSDSSDSLQLVCSRDRSSPLEGQPRFDKKGRGSAKSGTSSKRKRVVELDDPTAESDKHSVKKIDFEDKKPIDHSKLSNRKYVIDLDPKDARTSSKSKGPAELPAIDTAQPSSSTFRKGDCTTLVAKANKTTTQDRQSTSRPIEFPSSPNTDSITAKVNTPALWTRPKTKAPASENKAKAPKRRRGAEKNEAKPVASDHLKSILPAQQRPHLQEPTRSSDKPAVPTTEIKSKEDKIPGDTSRFDDTPKSKVGQKSEIKDTVVKQPQVQPQPATPSKPAASQGTISTPAVPSSEAPKTTPATSSAKRDIVNGGVDSSSESDSGSSSNSDPDNLSDCFTELEKKTINKAKDPAEKARLRKRYTDAGRFERRRAKQTNSGGSNPSAYASFPGGEEYFVKRCKEEREKLEKEKADATAAKAGTSTVPVATNAARGKAKSAKSAK